MHKYSNAVFEGGGTSGISYCGALRVFDDATVGSFTRDLKNYAGSSVGSIYAAALAGGASVDYLENRMRRLDFNTLLDDSWGVCQDVYRLVMEYGFYKGDALTQVVGDVLHDLTGDSEITFAKLYDRSSRHLVVTGTDVSSGSTLYMSRIRYPEMRVRDAVRISAGFPLFFRAVTRDDRYYADGGILDNYPLGVFDTSRYCVDGYNTETIGFKINRTGDYDDIDKRYEDAEAPPVQPINCLKQYSERLIDIIYDQCQRVHVKERDWERSVIINVGDYSALDFALTDEQKNHLVDCGVSGAYAYMDRHRPSSTPVNIDTRSSSVDYGASTQNVIK